MLAHSARHATPHLRFSTFFKRLLCGLLDLNGLLAWVIVDVMRK